MNYLFKTFVKRDSTFDTNQVKPDTLEKVQFSEQVFKEAVEALSKYERDIAKEITELCKSCIDICSTLRKVYFHFYY